MSEPKPTHISGIFFMVLGMAGMSAVDATAKWLVTSDYSVFQVIAVRGWIIVVIMLIWIAARHRWRDLKTSRVKGHGLRLAIAFAGPVFMFLALREMPLADVTVIIFGSAFLTTALSVPLFKEPVGARRGQRGTPLVEEARVTLSYLGLDDVARRTVLQFSPRPTQITESTAAWVVDLDPQQSLTLELTTRCQVGAQAIPTGRYADALPKVTRRQQRAQARACIIESSNEQFNAWTTQSLADLYLMLTPKDAGPYPYAGIPWFCTAFGRDGLITALQTLWVDPAIAKGVLTYLAHRQATVVDAKQDAEPGKILHETRTGEMAATGEIPFGVYYGSVDATPLFLMLLGAYDERTDDTALVEQLWPAAKRALAWMEQYGDTDGDGFLEYASGTSRGLQHQGWKDSDDAVFHADGRLAEGPIALCEVQGYLYAARCAVAKLAAKLGHAALAEQQAARAASLGERRIKVSANLKASLAEPQSEGSLR